MKFNRNTISGMHAALSIPAFLWLAGCASIGTPSGGPRDEEPPRFVSANPAPGALNVSNEHLNITFNELITVTDPMTKVAASPVQGGVPRITATGRRVNIVYDSLLPNTTYTLDFADAIADNNEGNKLQNFSYSFSTGPEIDTLRISGMVLGAQDAEPQQGILVGAYLDLSDTAFIKTPLLRIAKTDEYGRFSIRGLKALPYRIFALNDLNRDYKYNSFEEAVAFYPEPITPYSVSATALDTTFNILTGQVDTVIERSRTRFLPDDILLRSFTTAFRDNYLKSYERIDSTRLFIKFGTTFNTPPVLTPLNFTPANPDWVVMERTAGNDSLVYWLDPELLKVDSLRIAVAYPKNDSTLHPVTKIDSLYFIAKRPRITKNKKPVKLSVTDSLTRITFAFKAVTPSNAEIYDPVIVETPAPLASLDDNAYRLLQLNDTTWTPVSGNPKLLKADSLAVRRYAMEYPWVAGQKYKLEIDTLAARDLYGKASRPFKYEFTVKKPEEYSTISFRLNGLEPGDHAYVDLLAPGDKIIRSLPVKDDYVRFDNLAPGRYFARLILEETPDGIFTPGDYRLVPEDLHPDSLALRKERFDERARLLAEREALVLVSDTVLPPLPDLQLPSMRPDTLVVYSLQPDVAYYYPKVINIKKNWDKEEIWDVFATAVDMQKPFELKKNRPTVRGGKSGSSTTDEEEDEDFFDPTANPFDPNQKAARQRNRNNGLRY